MQRPRNRQGRGSPQTDRGGGNRGRGRGGRGARGGRPFDDRGTSNVPNISQVLPGAPVSIVLKVDQPTGREVQGSVADVLTSGNHPRGIKVRLADGRVGRVQRMASEEEARSGSAGLNGLGRNGEGPAQFAPRVQYTHVHDEREVPAAGYSLGDFLPVGHPLQQNGTESQQPQKKTEEVVIKCPVCGDFEGDEAAVSHHVNTHFNRAGRLLSFEIILRKKTLRLE